jgi:hypothetical protein
MSGSLDTTAIVRSLLKLCMRKSTDRPRYLKRFIAHVSETSRRQPRRWSEQARATRPFVFGAEYRDRDFGRIGVGDDAVLVEIVGGFLDLDIAGQ